MVYYLVVNLADLGDLDESLIMSLGYKITLFIALFNICTNPFIYAAKYDEVKKRLLGWFVCNLVGQQGTMALNTAGLPIQNTAATRARVALAPRPEVLATMAQSQCDRTKIITKKMVEEEPGGGLAASAENECQPGTSQSAF
jgi:hypothetical protein